MSLSDCDKCCNTPCTCGYEYRNWNKEYRIKYAATVLGVDIKAFTVLFGCFVPNKHPQSDIKETDEL